MIEWQEPPSPVTWTLAKPLVFGSQTYPAVTLRAPLASEVQKATAVRGISNLEATLRLISAVSGEVIPYEALQGLPHYIVEQMDAYLNLFGGSPYPGPLQEWMEKRAAAERANAAELTAAGTPAPGEAAAS